MFDDDFEDEYRIEVRRARLPADDEVVEARPVYVPAEVQREEDRWRADRAGKAMLIVLGSLLILAALAVLGVRYLGGTTVATTEVVATPGAAQPTAAPDLDPALTVEPVVVATFEPSPVTITTVPRPPLSMEEPASLASGIVHGLIAPVTFVLSLIAPTIRMYDLTNAGPLYDIGFLIGVLMLLALLGWRLGGRRLFA
jgi:hypothetical protein